MTKPKQLYFEEQQEKRFKSGERSVAFEYEVKGKLLNLLEIEVEEYLGNGMWSVIKKN